jgi:hypothetical protein
LNGSKAGLFRRGQPTIEMYKHNMRLYVLPHWRDTPVVDLKPVRIEKWLGTLQRKDGESLAPGRRSKFVTRCE